MYDLALSVAACLRAGTDVDVAWLADPGGLPADPTDAVALTPGGGRIGSLLGGALDGQLAELAGRALGSGRLVSLSVSDVDALVAGLPGGGQVRCLVVPARELPADLWDALLARRPVWLSTRVDGDRVLGTELGEPDADTPSDSVEGTTVTTLTTVLRPVPTLLVVGTGEIAEALAVAATPLGWRVELTNDPATATGTVARLSPLDALVVAAHDLELAGTVLAAALGSDAGYVGAVGGRRMQAARADWLAYRGHTDRGRIHAPAGLDIGADAPAEVAIAILAEALAVLRRSP